jgi:hypothetical protein
MESSPLSSIGALGGAIAVLITAVLVFLINYYIIRWIFSVNRQLKKQDVIIDLLFVIAKRNGATSDELGAIEKQYGKSFKGTLDY